MIGLFCGLKTTAQTDSIQRLETVVLVADKYVKQKVTGQKIIAITAKDIAQNNNNPTETLRFNSPIAIRDTGNGGASSARFRGTSASNTAFLWNGININNFGLGQTDLNGISIATSDEILVKSGGGSIKYGSGAIGGTVHLNDFLYYKDHQKVQVLSSYGSFNTTSNVVNAHVGTQKWSFKLGTTYHQSANDYDLIDDRYKDKEGKFLKNENGAYQNYSFNLSGGYQINPFSTLQFYSTWYRGDRLFSGALPNPSAADEKYKDANQRNLLTWDWQKKHWHHLLKTAYLTQEYRYYENKNKHNYDYGNSTTYIANYDVSYKKNGGTRFSWSTDLQRIEGETNQISKKNREQFAVVLGVESELCERLNYHIELKKEWNSDFRVPVIASLAGEFNLKKNHKVLLNLGTNYRVPSFNDLYWPGQGNLNLRPETAKQIELGYQVIHQNLTIKSTLFWMDVDDKIVWVPNANLATPNAWSPMNIEASYHQGGELFLGWKYWIHQKSNVQLTTNYTFTDAKNEKTNKMLIFVPQHLLNAKFSYQLKKWDVYLQNLTQSSVYTSEDNLEQLQLGGFGIFNAGLGCQLTDKKHQIHLGLSVKNLTNQLYQFSRLRPMPGRNYQININYKFN